MSKKKIHTNVSEKELDNLLNQAFLNLDFTNPKNEELMETISNEVMGANPGFGDTILKSLFAKITAVVILIITSALIYLSFFNHKIPNVVNENELKQTATEKATNQSTSELLPQPNSNDLNNNLIVSAINKDTTIAVNKKEEAQNTHMVVVAESTTKIKSSNDFIEDKTTKLEDTSYVFPKLTEKEIKDTKRQKQIMAMMLVKPNKYWYPLIGAGSKQSGPVYGNTSDPDLPFYIARAEVTNLEYRTFLFDLLIHNEKEAFLIAKPHQDLWLSALEHAKGKEMKDEYFSNKKYNDYPVVNITPDGAELYCKWLSNITETEDGKIYARLPYESEWINAARASKNKNANYTWGTDSIQNLRGCYLANFCIQKQKEHLKTYMECKPKNNKAYTSAEFMLGDSMMTTKVYSYNPNENGVYCMMGNVAEMVRDNKTKEIKTKGGSWNSSFEECKMSHSEELSGSVKANSMTGFRPVFRLILKNNFGSIDRDDPKTGLTTLNAAEIKNTEKQKQKIIDAVIKFNKDDYSLLPMGTCIYKNEAVSVQSFYMQTTEVTNLQYRTFLADLLIQKREADYLVAKPKQEMWVTKFPWSYNVPMQNFYFWHPAYDHYPVVNISRQAAEMYCDWLTKEVNKVLKAKNKPLINDIRIPVDIEWAYAANNKNNHVRYANGSESLKDTKGSYLQNYSCYSLNECRYDSIMKLYLPQSAQKPKDNESQERNFVSDGNFHTSPTKYFTANSYGLYDMAGNVAEMVNVFDMKTKSINGKGTKGGSWFSCDYFLETDANEEYPNETGPTPLIGFRPVITISGHN